jgi:hypothetical protein
LPDYVEEKENIRMHKAMMFVQVVHFSLYNKVLVCLLFIVHQVLFQTTRGQTQDGAIAIDNVQGVAGSCDHYISSRPSGGPLMG